MSNKMLARFIKTFQESRQEWIDTLVKNPDATDAAQHVVAINSKIELLRGLWNWSEEGEMP